MLRGGGKYSSSSVTRDLLDAVAGRQAGEDGVDQLLGRRGPGRDPDDAWQVVGQLVDVVDPVRPGGSRPRGPASRGPGCSTSWPSRSPRSASQRGAIAISADWRLVVAKHRSERPASTGRGSAPRVASSTSAQSRWDSVVWASSATGLVEARAARRPRRPTRPGGWPRAPPPSCRPPPRGPRGRRRRSGSPCRPAPSPRGAPW